MHLQSKKKHQHNESGFIIMIISILLVLFGFFITAIMKDTKPNQFYFETATQTKMEDVKTALAAYVHRNHRMPCPATDETGTEHTGRDANKKCTQTSGILPFRELGLTEDYAKDEWGHFFTYKVSPDFTRETTDSDLDPLDGILVSKNTTQDYLHQFCRTDNWVEQNKAGYNDKNGNHQNFASATDVNNNIYKARFCCPSNVVGAGGGPASMSAETPRHMNQQGGRSVTFTDTNAPKSQLKLSIGSVENNQKVKDLILASGETFHQTRYDDSDEVATQGILDFQHALRHGGKGFGILSDMTQWETGYYKTNDPDNVTLTETTITENGVSTGIGKHSGKFYYQSAVFELEGEGDKTKDMTFTMGDLTGNENEPVYVSMDVKGADGNVIPGLNLGFVIQNPSNHASGVGDLKVSLDFFKNGNDPYNHGAAKNQGGLLVDEYGNSKALAESTYNDSKDALIAYFNLDPNDANFAADFAAEIDKLTLSTVRMNGAPSSLAFNGVSYTNSGATGINDTDLAILDGTGARRLDERDSSGSYGAASSPHTGAVTQDFEAAAYALISHGPDGEGSYHRSAAGNWEQVDNITPDTLENPNEVDNHSTGREVVDMRKVVSSDQSKKFDDIVMWDSQVTIYNALRNGSCGSAQTL